MLQPSWHPSVHCLGAGSFLMRSAEELSYRLRQEFVNLRLLAAPPSVRFARRGVSAGIFPAATQIAAQLSNTSFAEEILQLSQQILRHNFPIFGTHVETGPSIDWRRDYKNQVTSGLSYFRLIPYLNVARTGDHKWVWELNRLQHLVVLAQAFLFTGDRGYLQEIERQVHDWIRQNPFQRGINWASALEVGFRAMSLAWVLQLVAPELSVDVAERIEKEIYLHSLHLENNLSVYFSPNTHLLGEAAALHALGVLFPHFPNAARARRSGRHAVLEQIERQVHADGSHFERSSYYHVYALDMFLFHAVLEPADGVYRTKLRLMASFLHRLLSGGGKLPFLGDDDGGRWFHPYGDRAAFGWATLAACNAFFVKELWPCNAADYWSQASWWLPGGTAPPSVSNEVCSSKSSILFPDSGLIFLEDGTCKAIFNVGPFGPGSAGHSHSDALSLTVSVEGTPWLVDSGTFTYVGSASERNQFRASAAHNTIRIDDRDQADPAGPFRWVNLPQVRLLRWESSPEEDVAAAACRYRGFEHRRYVHFLKNLVLLIVDIVEGSAGEHAVEQFWHLEADDLANRFRFAQRAELLSGWRSRCFGQREPAPVLRVARKGSLPAILPAAICLSGSVDVEIVCEQRIVHFHVKSPSAARIIDVDCFPDLR